MVRSPCSDDNNLKKGPWTPEEDQKLVDHINKHGYGNWKTLPKLAGLKRCGKSCRLRWTNYLRPDIKRGKFSEEEERIMINLHAVLGNKWSRIATHLPGRTDNEIKNFWNTHIRKKLLHMGIDPATHKPRTDFNHLLSLSQLLSTSLMNPWDNIALRLQTDTAQLAKIQLLQNLLQIFNLSTLANTSSESNGLLGTQNIVNTIEGLVNKEPNLMAPASLINSQATNENQAFANSWTSSSELGGFEQEGLNVGNCIQQYQSILPPLVSASPESSSMSQKEGKNTIIHDQYLSPTSPPNSSTIFEAWEKLMDDETSDAYWKDILD